MLLEWMVEPTLVVEIGQTDVRLHGEVRLPLQVVFVFDDVGGRFHQRRGVLALGALLLVVDVGRAGVDFDRILGHGGRRTHVGRQLLELHVDLLGGRPGILLRVRGHDGDGVAELKDFLDRRGSGGPSRRPCWSGKVIRPVMRFLPLTSLWVMTFDDPGHLLGV